MGKLTELANKAGSDKGTLIDEAHGFTEFYEPYFREIKNRALAKKEKIYVLEVGIWKGASLQMLSDYFGKQNCEIYGLDIDLSNNECVGKNIHVFEANQNLIDNLINVAEQHFKDIKFDIIIDDGGHFYNQQFNTLLAYHKYLKEDGIYILEDLHTSLAEPDINVYSVSPLAFLTARIIPQYLTQDQVNDLVGSIKETIIFRRENPKSICGAVSITSIIKFKN